VLIAIARVFLQVNGVIQGSAADVIKQVAPRPSEGLDEISRFWHPLGTAPHRDAPPCTWATTNAACSAPTRRWSTWRTPWPRAASTSAASAAYRHGPTRPARPELQSCFRGKSWLHGKSWLRGRLRDCRAARRFTTNCSSRSRRRCCLRCAGLHPPPALRHAALIVVRIALRFCDGCQRYSCNGWRCLCSLLFPLR